MSFEQSGARLSSLRGVGVGCNAFAVESFLDEIAKAQHKDPLEFRLALSEGDSLTTSLRNEEVNGPKNLITSTSHWVGLPFW